jgi:hypothetical protein
MRHGAAQEGGLDPGGGNPGTAALGRARGRQGKREKGESGGTEQWAGPEEWGPAVEIEKKGERVTGGARDDKWV